MAGVIPRWAGGATGHQAATETHQLRTEHCQNRLAAPLGDEGAKKASVDIYATAATVARAARDETIFAWQASIVSKSREGEDSCAVHAASSSLHLAS